MGACPEQNKRLRWHVHRCSPLCQLYAVDMAFCGGEGLVTSKASATFIMVCSQVTY